MTFGIDALLQATLAKNGSRDAFRCGEETITYAQLDGRARAVAALLHLCPWTRRPLRRVWLKWRKIVK